MNVTAEQLAAILAAPDRPSDAVRERALRWIQPLTAAMARYQINTPLRIAAFLAQVAHESARLTRVIENLNYGAPGLMATWPKRFPDLATAQKYERNPVEIANYVYGGRMGNESHGDGWRYRGRGPLQITGRNLYGLVGAALSLDLIARPVLLEAPEHGAMAAGWFWSDHKHLNALADIGDMTGITRLINGGTHGLKDRLELYDVALDVLGVTAEG